jgi:Flp pilus assembly protein TadG
MVGPHKARGQSLLEFALIIPLVIFIITLFFDLGRLVYYSSTLNNAVREGARFAISRTTTTNDAEVVTRVKTYSIGMNGNNITVTVDITTVPDFVIVTATYSFVPVTPGLKLLLPAGNVPMEAKSTMAIAPRYQN